MKGGGESLRRADGVRPESLLSYLCSRLKTLRLSGVYPLFMNLRRGVNVGVSLLRFAMPVPLTKCGQLSPVINHNDDMIISSNCPVVGIIYNCREGCIVLKGGVTCTLKKPLGHPHSNVRFPRMRLPGIRKPFVIHATPTESTQVDVRFVCGNPTCDVQ